MLRAQAGGSHFQDTPGPLWPSAQAPLPERAGGVIGSSWRADETQESIPGGGAN